MSEETQGTSQEDRFLGVRTTIEPPEPVAEADTAEDLQIEVVDDRPQEDQRAAPQQKSDDDGVANDEELKEVGQRVQKRIKKLKWEYHEERRAKEAAERLSNEAVSYTQGLQTENQRLLKLVADSQNALSQQSQSRADAAMAIAEANFKTAHESGDAEQIAVAQKALTDAQLARAAAPAVSQKIIDNWKKQVLAESQQMAAQQQQYQPEPIQPDPQALEWQDRNPWFGVDPEMTSFAYGVHERLVGSEGIDPTSEEYYQLIDSRMKEVFPTQFSSGNERTNDSAVVVDTAQPRKAKPVVAPASRNAGARPRTVKLTETQVRLAKRLGLTNEQYAKQLMKEMA
tara:strand:+ start:2532 stop:3557 length:1026 start_codon:yes stop_codon:yes gene_type:complete